MPRFSRNFGIRARSTERLGIFERIAAAFSKRDDMVSNNVQRFPSLFDDADGLLPERLLRICCRRRPLMG
jgi:hypothetical protein